MQSLFHSLISESELSTGQGDISFPELHTQKPFSVLRPCLHQSVDHTYCMICDEELKKLCMDKEHDGSGWYYRNDLC